MEFNLPQWLFGWYQLLFMAYVAAAVVPTAAIIVGNNEKAMSGKPALFFHILGKVGLAVALVMGVYGKAVALIERLQEFKERYWSYLSGKDTDSSASNR